MRPPPFTPTGGVPDAQDADVVWHENGHAIQNDQVPGWGATHDALSIGEGWGDYWAFSHGAGKGPNRSWDPYVFKWDATAYNPGDPAFLRVVNSTKHYPENMDYVNFDVHADGEMWSACLYQLWNLLGKQKADTIILESNFYLSPSASFIDGAHAILKANAALYNGASYAAIRQIFVDRGFLDSQGIGAATPNYTISGTITGPSPSGVSVAASATATSPYVAGAEPGMDVPAGNTTGASFPINVPLNASITSVTLGVSVQSANGGHIEILVKGPDGTTVIVKDPNPTDNSTTNIVTSYPNLTPSAHPLTAFNTKNAKGTWTVQVLDPTSGDTDGLFNWFTLSLTFSSGTYQKTVASRSDGSYFLTQLPSATYTVTPSKTGTSYTPPTRAVPLTSNVSSQDFVQTQPKLTAFSVSSNTMLAGDSGLATLTLSSSIGANTAVQLASSNSALSVAPTCTISGGQTRGATSVTARAVSASTSVTLSAKLNDVTKTVTISVLPAPALRQLTLVSGVVHGGGTMGASVRLAGATPAPMRVTLASSDASVTLPAFVIVPAGASSVSFTVQTSMVRQQEQVGLSATRGSNVVGSILYVVP